MDPKKGKTKKPAPKPGVVAEVKTTTEVETRGQDGRPQARMVGAKMTFTETVAGGTTPSSGRSEPQEPSPRKALRPSRSRLDQERYRPTRRPVQARAVNLKDIKTKFDIKSSAKIQPAQKLEGTILDLGKATRSQRVRQKPPRNLGQRSKAKRR